MPTKKIKYNTHKQCTYYINRSYEHVGAAILFCDHPMPQKPIRFCSICRTSDPSMHTYLLNIEVIKEAQRVETHLRKIIV